MLRQREDLHGLNAELREVFDRSEWARAEEQVVHASLGATHRAVKLLLSSGAWLLTATSTHAAILVRGH